MVSVRVALILLLSAAAGPVAGGPGTSGEAAGTVGVPGRLDLARRPWTRDGEPAHLEPVEVSPVPAPGGDADDLLEAAPEVEHSWRLARLVMDDRGRRWATTFDLDEARMARMALDLRGGPEGLVYEIVLDGERLSPPRDAWRPTPRRLVVDLGPRFLGAGEHLLEFVAREAGGGALEPAALILVKP